MKSAVITSGDHWLSINTIAYLRGSITPIEPVTYIDGREGVKISSSVKELVIDVDGTTIDGNNVGSQTELISFLREFAYANGSGGTDGVTQEEFQARNAEVDERIDEVAAINGAAPYPITGLTLPQTPGATDLPDRASGVIYGDNAGRTYTQTGGTSITVAANKGRSITYNKTTNLWTAGQEFNAATIGVNSVSTTSLQDDSVTKQKADFIVQTKNIFDKSTVTPNFYMSNTGVLTASTDFSVSDFIPVVQGDTYIGSRNVGTPIRFTTYFDSNNSVVSGGSNSSLTQFTVPTGTGIAFVKITVYNVAIDDTMLRKSTDPAGYVPYGFYISNTISGFESKSGFLSWTSEGDSITAQNRWQVSVSNALQLTPTNVGIGGTRISGNGTNAMCDDVRVNSIPLNSQVITLLGGTNDWANNVPLGDNNSTDRLTFYGAINVWLQKVITRCPNAKIFLGLTPIGRRTAPLPSGWTDPFVNAIGLTTSDYAKVLQEAAFTYGLPIINFNSLGWNRYNLDNYVPDGLHPQGIGAEQMSKEAIFSMRDRLRLP